MAETPLLNLADRNVDEKQKVRSVYRLRTTCWDDGKSLHIKRSLTLLKRLSAGNFDHLLEESIQVGAYDAIEKITNLHDCKDGVYTAVVINQFEDYETGIVEDWEYKLVPYNPEPSTGQTSEQP